MRSYIFHKRQFAVLVALLAIGWQSVCSEVCHEIATHEHGHEQSEHQHASAATQHADGPLLSTATMAHEMRAESCGANQTFVKKPRIDLDSISSIVPTTLHFSGLAETPMLKIGMADRSPPAKVIAQNIPFLNHISILV